MASSRVEEYEGAIERGDEGVLSLPQVAETREELSTGLLCFSLRASSFRVDLFFVPAIEYFEHAKSADPSAISEDQLAALRPLVSNSLILSTQTAGHPHLLGFGPL